MDSDWDGRGASRGSDQTPGRIAFGLDAATGVIGRFAPAAARRGLLGADAVATDAALRDPGEPQPQRAAARRQRGNGRPEAGIRDTVTADRSRPMRRLGLPASRGAILRMAERTEKGPAEAEP